MGGDGGFLLVSMVSWMWLVWGVDGEPAVRSAPLPLPALLLCGRSLFVLSGAGGAAHRPRPLPLD